MNQCSHPAWEEHVGRLILHFGTIELRLIQLHWNLSIAIPNSNKEEFRAQPLKRKLEHLKKVIARSQIDESLAIKLRDTLAECDRLRNIRNLVAHNPLTMVEFFEANKAPEIQEGIRSLRNSEEQITKEELKIALEQISEVSTMLQQLLTDPKIWNWAFD